MACAAKRPAWSLVPASGFSWLVPGFSWLARARSIFKAWQRRARDRDALRRLNDYYLRDIGVTRHDVMLEGSKPFWRL